MNCVSTIFVGILKSTKPTISACIISYNQQEYIAQTLEGALMQQVDVPYEIVVSDDCSTDNTAQIIEAFAKKDARIRVLRHHKNVGMHRNWLQAINACRGEFVALCEGDDTWTDNQKLTKQLAVLQANTKLSCCFTDAALQAEKTIHLRFNSYLKENDVDLNRSIFNLEDLSQTNFIPTCTILFRKEMDLVLPPEYFKSPYADWFVHIYNALRGDFYLIPEKTACYRLHEAGVFGKIEQKQRNAFKLRCLALLYQGFYHHKNARSLLRLSTLQAIDQQEAAERSSGSFLSFLHLRILGKLFHLTGFAIFARQAARV